MTEAHDQSPRPHAQQATRPSPTPQTDMRPESQRRKRSSFIKAKLMFRLSFFSFRKPSCARMRLPENVSSLKPHEMRPQNETMERHAGKGPRDEALGWNPKTKCPKVFKTGLECGIFFRTSAANATSPSLQLNITPGRFLEEIRTLSSPPKERHIRGPF